MLAQVFFVVAGPLLMMQSAGDCQTAQKPENAVPNLKQEVEGILDEWQRREPKVKRAAVQFQRYEYDEVFAIEKRGEGELHFEPRQTYSWTLKPSDVNEGIVIARETRFGKRYTVRAETAMTIFVDDHQVVVADPEQMTYNVVELPPNIDLWRWETLSPPRESPTGFWERAFALFQYPSWIDARASLLTGTNIEQLREAFKWSFSAKTREGIISLSAVPIDAELARQIQRVDVLLDPDHYRTTGVRIIGPAATKSTVIVPSNIEVNGTVEAVKPPSLRGYKLAGNTAQRSPQTERETEYGPTWWPILVRIALMHIGIRW